MSRRLPDDPLKRRLQQLKRIYQHLSHFRELMISGEMSVPGIVTMPDGEEIYLGDLMVGIDTLPPRQRQAFELICLHSYTETAATKIILPNSKWPTPVQQYADTALARMVRAYDLKQAGQWPPRPLPVVVKPKKEKRKSIMSTVSDVLKRHLMAARDELLEHRSRIDAEIGQVESLLKGARAQEKVA